MGLCWNQNLSVPYDPNNQTARKSQKEIVGNPVSKDAASLTRTNMIWEGRIRFMEPCITQHRQANCNCSWAKCSPQVWYG